MTVSATHRFNSFIPNGIVLVFGFTFRCDDVAWISVLRDNVVVGGYTVLLNADQTASPGGSVTFAVAPVGTLLVVKRDTQLTQTTVYNPYGRFPAKSHETALDKLTLQVQDFAELASRVAVATIGSPPINITYPPYVANKVWAWDPTVNGRVINTDGSVEAVNAAAASAAAALASQNAAAASATNAAASYDSFDDRYLGPKAAAPTLDNDGNALLVGALYWNTGSSTLHAWTGTVWTVIVLNAAGLNVANIFTQPQTIQSAQPELQLTETGVAADNGRWKFYADAEALRLTAVNDADSVAGSILAVERTGTTIDSVTIGGTTVAVTNALTVGLDATIHGVKVGRGPGAVASNTAVGVSALNANTTGSNNTGVGSAALLTNIIGNSNTALGLDALRSSTSSDNTAVGKDALRFLSTGGQNTAVGQSSGQISTGSNDSCFGFGAAASSNTVSNEITLGNASVATLRCQVTTITALSDARDKTNIVDIPLGLDFIKDLRPRQFVWNMRDGAKVGQVEGGFIAQELKAAQVEHEAEWLGLVYEENPERLEASPGKLIPILVKAIQELSAEFHEYKATHP